MPETNIVGPYGNVGIDRIGVPPVVVEGSFLARFDIWTLDNQFPPDEFFDANKCTPPATQAFGWSVNVFVYVDGELRSSNSYCVRRTPTDDPVREDIYVPFDLTEGGHSVRFVFEYDSGDVIGEEEYTIRKEDLSVGQWQDIGEGEEHETGDVVELSATLEAPDVPFQDLLMNFVGDLITLQQVVNSELPGQEEITVLDADMFEVSGDGMYEYRMVYHVDHASPIAATTIIAILGAAIIAASVAFTSLQVRKAVQEPGGAEALSIWGVAAVGGVAYLFAKDAGLLDGEGG